MQHSWLYNQVRETFRAIFIGLLYVPAGILYALKMSTAVVIGVFIITTLVGLSILKRYDTRQIAERDYAWTIGNEIFNFIPVAQYAVLAATMFLTFDPSPKREVLDTSQLQHGKFISEQVFSEQQNIS